MLLRSDYDNKLTAYIYCQYQLIMQCSLEPFFELKEKIEKYVIDGNLLISIKLENLKMLASTQSQYSLLDCSATNIKLKKTLGEIKGKKNWLFQINCSIKNEKQTVPIDLFINYLRNRLSDLEYIIFLSLIHPKKRPDSFDFQHFLIFLTKLNSNLTILRRSRPKALKDLALSFTNSSITCFFKNYRPVPINQISYMVNSLQDSQQTFYRSQNLYLSYIERFISIVWGHKEDLYHQKIYRYTKSR